MCSVVIFEMESVMAMEQTSEEAERSVIANRQEAVDEVMTVFMGTLSDRCNLHRLGTHLGLSANELDKLEHGSSDEIFYQNARLLVEMRLQQHGSQLTWEELASALRRQDIKEDVTADRIEYHYIKGRGSSISISPVSNMSLSPASPNSVMDKGT